MIAVCWCCVRTVRARVVFTHGWGGGLRHARVPPSKRLLPVLGGTLTTGRHRTTNRVAGRTRTTSSAGGREVRVGDGPHCRLHDRSIDSAHCLADYCRGVFTQLQRHALVPHANIAEGQMIVEKSSD